MQSSAAQHVWPLYTLQLVQLQEATPILLPRVPQHAWRCRQCLRAPAAAVALRTMSAAPVQAAAESMHAALAVQFTGVLCCTACPPSLAVQAAECSMDVMSWVQMCAGSIPVVLLLLPLTGEKFLDGLSTHKHPRRWISSNGLETHFQQSLSTGLTSPREILSDCATLSLQGIGAANHHMDRGWWMLTSRLMQIPHLVCKPCRLCWDP